MSTESEEKIKWLPLASDPVVFNGFARDVGWPVDAWHFTDIWGLDEDLLGAQTLSPSSLAYSAGPSTEERMS